MGRDQLTIGFVPLCDAAPLVLAQEEGLFSAFDLDVTLSKEHSWARIRDKLAVGDLHAAHMLAPMVVGSALGLSPVKAAFATAFGFNLNGNGITVSNALYREMQEIDPGGLEARPVTAEALRIIAARRLHAGRGPITLAMVYPFSSHNYLLRYWLASSGLHPDRDVRLIVAPPPDMVRLCEAESIDGYCVGEPWNTLAMDLGVGQQIVAGSEIWPAAPEKVLGVRREWLEENGEVHTRLIRALIQAAGRLQTPQGKDAAAVYLSREEYIGLDQRHIAKSLGSGANPALAPMFDPSVAGFPWHSKAAWIAMQMVRWGQMTKPADINKEIAASFRTDLYRVAAQHEGIGYPLIDSVVEGAHQDQWMLGDASVDLKMPSDRVMDGAAFDPTRPVLYLERFARHSIRLPLGELT